MKFLTPKQKIILNVVKNYALTKGQMPTVREIMEEAEKQGLKLKSTRSVFLYLEKLEEKGLIKRNNKKRGIELPDQSSSSFLSVPIYGTANAGTPTMFAEEYIEGYLKISRRIARNRKLFAIQIDGDSMNESEIEGKKIDNGDFILVQSDLRNYSHGDKVLAVIDGLATVKIYKRLGPNRIGLFPESNNPSHQPIFLTNEDDFIINGKVVDVFKVS
jgi:SOS regulatory protein LexA